MNRLMARAVLGAILVSPLAVALAQEPPPAAAPGADKPQTEGRRHPGGPPCGPPPEAYQACEGKSAGSRAEFTSPKGDKVQGACESGGGGKMVLRPDHPPGGAAGKHRQPPPEAYQACVGKKAGDRAQFPSPKGDTITGTCQGEGDKLVLRPDKPPQDGGGERQSDKPTAPPLL